MEESRNETIRKIQSQTADIAEETERATREVGTAIADRIRALSEKTGRRMGTVAAKLREGSPRIEAALHKAAENVAKTLEDGGSYLSEKDFRSLTRDVTGVVRQHPVPSLLIALGIGLYMGRRRD